jgi:UDP-N-acetylglucosamine 2-epimerase (non-hydrolysing)
MKIAPVLLALEPGAQVTLVHTGQHYDERMSDAFFRELGIREPDLQLGVGSGTHAEQTAGVLVEIERHLLDAQPDAIVVVGDVNSTLAASLAAAKLQVPVAHVEAGLRSHDWSMPEEVNRVVTDRLSRWLFTTSADADENLLREGADPARIHLVGNVMIDTLLRQLDGARAAGAAARVRLGLEGDYAVMTLHRPSNVDDAVALHRLMESVVRSAGALPVVFPIHPRTRATLESAGLALAPTIVDTEPLPYLEFIGLVDGARFVVTDSGGIQEETSVLGVPCLTLRTTTERPITCTRGTNQLIGVDPNAVATAVRAAVSTERHPADIPFWDGHASGRIAEILLRDLSCTST